MHITFGSATGADHINLGQPGKTDNQDAFATRKFAKGFVTAICDGCGSQPHSGTGADIGAHLIAQIVKSNLAKQNYSLQINWSEITKEIADALKIEAKIFAVDNSIIALEQSVLERFLFTAVVLVVIDDTAIVASFGDGVVIVDEEVIDIKAPIENSPPYLGYLMIKNNAYRTPELKSHLEFSVVTTAKLSKLTKGLIVGTDGMKYFDLDDFHHPALVVQPKALQRWLNAKTAEQIKKQEIIPSNCRDDVTVVIVRTDEAQEILLKSRKKIVKLKGLIDDLKEDLKEFDDQLCRRSLFKVEAEKKFKLFETKLKTILDKSKEINSCVAKAQSLKTKVSSLRKDISKKAKKVVVVTPNVVIRGGVHNAAFSYLDQSFNSAYASYHNNSAYANHPPAHSKHCQCSQCKGVVVAKASDLIPATKVFPDDGISVHDVPDEFLVPNNDLIEDEYIDLTADRCNTLAAAEKVSKRPGVIRKAINRISGSNKIHSSNGSKSNVEHVVQPRTKRGRRKYANR